MKTKEFIKKVEALGYEVEADLDSMLLVKVEGTTICDVSKTEFAILDTDSYSNFKHIGYKKQKELFPILVDYASTDPADREEEKRYYLRNVSPLLRGSGRGYLAKNKDTLEYYALSLKCSEEFYQTIFTESEIAEMDITGFEKEPVE